MKRENTNNALDRHIKGDKSKWVITFISLILIATVLGGLCYVVVEEVDVKKEVTNTTSAVASSGVYSNSSKKVPYENNSFINNGQSSLLLFNKYLDSNTNKLDLYSISFYLGNDTFQEETSSYFNNFSIRFASGGKVFFSLEYDWPSCDDADPILGDRNTLGKFSVRTYTNGFSTSNYSEGYSCVIENVEARDIYLSDFVIIDFYHKYFRVRLGKDEYSHNEFYFDDSSTIFQILYDALSNINSNDISVSLYRHNLLDNEVEISEEYLARKPLPDTPSKEGYTFTGWYTDIDCFLKYYDKGIYEGQVLYPGWKINTYTVTFDSDGGSSVSSQTVDWNTSAKLTTPTKTGHTFVGWFLPSGEQYTNQPIKSATTLKAKWKTITFTIIFDSAGGSAVEDIIVEFGQILNPPIPTKNNVGFVGWFLPSGEQYTNQAITDNLTLTARWTDTKFTVTFNSDGGSTVENKTVEYGKSVTLTSPTKTGFDFVGWFLPSGDKYTNQAITDNVTLTARWTIKKLSVSFNTDGGTSISDKQVEYGKPVELPTTEKQGYNFKGWFLPSGDSYTNQAITENVTLTAKWEIKTFKVTFIVDGEVYREMTVDYGTTLVDVANKAEVSSKNILSYKYVDEFIPTMDLGTMKVVGAIEVKANVPTESDITISKIKNNTFAIIGGVLGGLVLIMVVSGVVTAIKRR